MEATNKHWFYASTRETKNEYAQRLLGRKALWCNTSKPKLTTDDLDGLLTFLHFFELDLNDVTDKEWHAEVKEDVEKDYGHGEDWAYTWDDLLLNIPAPVCSDIQAAIKYAKQLIAYNLRLGELTLKTDLTLKEVKYDLPVTDYLELVKDWPVSRAGNPLPPRVTRKRANGMWWIINAADVMSEATQTWASWTTACQETKGAMWDEYWNGADVIAQVAAYHETKWPTAPRLLPKGR
tara:strand:- start:323 stop:1030 length:708 start_codon:yes stop_codon:yes gene_type:complete